jgi:hypothetical protein
MTYSNETLQWQLFRLFVIFGVISNVYFDGSGGYCHMDKIVVGLWVGAVTTCFLAMLWSHRNSRWCR